MSRHKNFLSQIIKKNLHFCTYENKVYEEIYMSGEDLKGGMTGEWEGRVGGEGFRKILIALTYKIWCFSMHLFL